MLGHQPRRIESKQVVDKPREHLKEVFSTCLNTLSNHSTILRWDVMTASGIKPNRITYNILISLCAKALFMNTFPIAVLLDI